MARSNKALVLGLSALVLAACGSEAPLPDAPSLNVSTRVNRIQLVWTSQIAGEYNVYRDADGALGAGGFSLLQRLPSSAVSFNIPASVHLFDWESEPQFYLEDCNLNGCARTSTFTITADTNKLATGYFKASNATPAKADRVGSSIGIDGLGSVMAVGAPLEDSNATGVILGDGSLAGQTIIDRAAPADGYEPAPESGAVYVYALNFFGEWVQLNYLKAPDITTSTDIIAPTAVSAIDPDAAAVAAQDAGGAGDQFGYAVAMSGNGVYLAVGAPLEDGGCVDVVNDGGETVCVAEIANNDAVDSGAVYIYERINSQWFLTNYIKPETIVDGAHFGASLSFDFSGITLAIGAPQDSMGDSGIFNVDEGPVTDEPPDMDLVSPGSGAVYVVVRTGISQWQLQAIVKSPIVTDNEEFGTVVALSNEGSTLAVGVPKENGSNSGVYNEGDVVTFGFLGNSVGAVYVYSRDPDADNFFNWFQQAYLKPSAGDIADDMRFGTAIDFSDFGDDLLVGAPGADAATGAAYLYQRAAAEWDTTILRFDADTLLGEGQDANADPDDRFGTSVALISLATFIDDNALSDAPYRGMIAVGAPGEAGSAQGVVGAPDDNTSGSGAVYLFLEDDVMTWSRTRYIKASNSGLDFEFGSVVDLTDIGTSLAVGAPGESVSNGGVGPDPDRDDPSDAVNQNTAAPGAGAVYLY